MADEVMPLMLGVSRLCSLVPAIREHDIAIAMPPGNFFIANLYALKVIMLFFGRIFRIVHHWRNTDNLHPFKQHVEILRFLTSVIDAIPFKFC